jgi:2-iminobutanoate/2-iminopropanoate deaminase
MSTAPPLPKTFGPYSPVRRAGNLYLTAGHVGVDPATGQADSDVVAQTATAIANLQTTLATVGLALDDVVKTTIFVTDMTDFGAVNEEYLKHFKEPRPARSTVAVKELPRVAAGVSLKIEIEAVAAAMPQIEGR